MTARDSAPGRDAAVPEGDARGHRLPGLDAATGALVRLAAAIAVAGEARVREVMSGAITAATPNEWIEEVILQSYLFAGFPRALNAAREWRRISGVPAPAADPGEDYGSTGEWTASGERTCAVVYGAFYERLRHNIRELHPALDAWMIVDGYGKVLSRPALDLVRRELCIVAVCAAAEQDRQLHSHLHGARNAGASDAQVDGALSAADEFIDEDARQRVRLLWARVRGK